MTQSTITAATDRLHDDLRRHVGGTVVSPGDGRYETQRLSWHRTIDPRPAVIVEAASAADIAVAVRAAGEHDVALAVQSTGHGTLAPADGALLLRTTGLTGVEVDPRRRTARVRPGTLWSEVIEAAAPYGLAPLSGTPAIGVVGYTLGGGAGWLSRAHGYAADNVVSAEVVTADGRRRTVSAEEHPDLFWALRGGGGAFAAVTGLEFRLYPVTEVCSGMTMYPVCRAAEVFRAYRDWAAGEPESLNTSVMIMHVPAIPQMPEPVRGRRVLAIRAFGTGEDVAQRLRPLTEAAGEPLVGGFTTMSFAEAAAAAGDPPPPMALRQHLDLLDDVPDALIDGLRAAADLEEAPDLMALELRHWGGAMATPPSGHGPVGHRDVPFSVLATAQAPDGDGAVRAVADVLAPYAHGGSFLNFHTDTTRTHAAYTAADHRRLTEVKRDWDPHQLFKPSHTIAPAPRRAEGEEER